MQRTRLNRIVDVLGARIEQFLGNPWRRISLLLISLFFGVFIGQAISTTSGQNSDWDIFAAGWLVLFTEIISRLFYGNNRRSESGGKIPRSLWLDLLNVFKIGVAYSLYLEAFKLGS
jgi:hypothetical protein